MNAPVNLLTHATEQVRPFLADTTPIKDRFRILWAAAKQARLVGSHDVVFDAFLQLADDAGLIDGKNSRHDVSHVVAWALCGWNPFEDGPLT